MADTSSASRIDHSGWTRLLQHYVDGEGQVDYPGFATDREALNSYILQLQAQPVADSAPKNERLAYYINLYNAATVQLILDHYPLQSIKDIARPWGKDIIRIGKKSYSLGDIEHKVLRKMDEPRIHFAINCASQSCPPLANTAYTAEGMEEQLTTATRKFVNDRNYNTIGTDQLSLSKIFQWYKKDFTAKGSLIDYINSYADEPVNGQAQIRYRPYDWNLNETARP